MRAASACAALTRSSCRALSRSCTRRFMRRAQRINERACAPSLFWLGIFRAARNDIGAHCLRGRRRTCASRIRSRSLSATRPIARSERMRGPALALVHDGGLIDGDGRHWNRLQNLCRMQRCAPAQNPLSSRTGSGWARSVRALLEMGNTDAVASICAVGCHDRIAHPARVVGLQWQRFFG